jgi:hypothetical protein
MKIYKHITIVILIFILFVLKAYSAQKIIFSLFPGTEQVYVLSQYKNYTCFQYHNYVVVTKDLLNSVGSDMFIKYFNWDMGYYNVEDITNEHDFQIKNEWAEYFQGIYKHYLFIDSGTGPGPRGLIIYNLRTKKKVFESEYSEPVFIDAKGIFSFWKTSEIPATEENCPEYSKFRADGFGVAIEKKVLLNLNDLGLSETGEAHCSSRQ